MGYLLSLQAMERDHDEQRNGQFASYISASVCLSNVSAVC
ncbi:SapB/AmfS family lanthipeptide [uncultured Microbacterium sp.]